MKMKYLVVGAAIAGLVGATADAVAACCEPPQLAAQQNSNSAQADVKTVKLEIEGMTCGSCAASITTALKKIDGVRTVEISFEQKGGTVEFDPAKANEQAIVEAVNNAGFKAQRVATAKS